MGKPETYYTVDDVECRNIPLDQSTFTSAAFRAMPALFNHVGMGTFRYDNSDQDFLHWLGKYSVLMSPVYTGVDAIIGGRHFALDNTNLELAKAAYISISEGDKLINYFPTQGLVDALDGTALQWIDSEVFAGLPEAFTIRFPKKYQFKMVQTDGEYSIDDFLLHRVTTPFLRDHVFAIHGEESPEPSWQAFAWIAQSRAQLSEGIQNTEFGSFIIKGHTKLEDLLTTLEAWSRGADKELENRDGAKIADGLDLIAANPDNKYQRENAKFFRDSIRGRLNRDDSSYQNYIKLIKFVLKFVILSNTEQFLTTKMPISGLKEGKTSKKAREIQEKLRWRWGTRYKVDVFAPKTDEMPSESHKSPIKHWVEGFFRRQAYGPQHSLRRIQWIPGFWRGSDQITT